MFARPEITKPEAPAKRSNFQIEGVRLARKFPISISNAVASIKVDGLASLRFSDFEFDYAHLNYNKDNQHGLAYYTLVSLPVKQVISNSGYSHQLEKMTPMSLLLFLI